MNNNDRPLSPHISIYRWPVTMVSSILHRATGIAMAAGFALLVFWLANTANGPGAYAALAAVMGSTVGRILLVGWSWAFFYHLANGIRHLVWDTGRGLEKGQATASAWFVIAASVVLTAVFWMVLS
ncbi:MAG: succinate dehydrogenase, cytochrome b556 subunit [Gammaproteobacteria bacterium]|nr:succinate dehydrogenase, cytochrome b556 subunit [Gammaproteobacteria bacterium]MBT8104700.1 succinate dehydrogenase, cytochrome b556 subunit [Gammaproteobacteria bacterium]NNF48907.1 succinate dehydrogenase, cytochrome b556 subunit [Woeseiaceae bacterium]NNK24714.1 succinate dehydrogenase, cytochrome b556 subunit [Woeseiaceae bacterium]NNL62427.1 succinate dehydrogenase, cytochrome b556 subunit [Woeseiaceae bacterium]